VLGGGVDVCYPRENIGLYTTLARKGGIISEYLPGFNPRKGTFPERNRLISGLADIVIVVEARKKSGSLITVDHALEQNKEVMAVPGRVNEPLSAGCNELIKSGAMMITCAEDIRNADAVQRWVERYADSKKNNLGTRQSQCNDDIENDLQVNLETNPLASVKNLVYSTTNLYPKDIDTIISESGLDISVVSEQLFELQLSGAIKEVGKNCYVRSGL
jgi:DNA processing protein